MLRSLLRAVFGNPAPAASERERLTVAQWPAAIYAVGDVHGCLAELELLEQAIYADGAAIEGDKWIVMLGDYVDRGPDSAGVIEHLMAPAPPGYWRICLTGNHETMMLAYFDEPLPSADWLRFGGVETLRSYAIDSPAVPLDANRMGQLRQALQDRVPAAHVAFLRQLPLYLRVGNTVFVHAGLRHGVPLDQQREQDLIWIRPSDDVPFEDGMTVVHGHTPVASPSISPWRIAIDTAAFHSGVLTAVRLMPGTPPKILQIGNEQHLVI